MKKISAILILIFLCYTNIFSQVIHGRAIIEKTGEPLNNISIELSEYNGLTKIFKTDSLGYFFINSSFLKTNTKYRIQSDVARLLHYEKIITTGNNPMDSIYVNLEFATLTTGPHFLYVHFNYNSYNLTPESMVAIDKLIIELINNKNICISILTTCETSELEKNKKICQKRGQTIITYIISKGVAKNRLSLKFANNSFPFITDKAIYEMYKIPQGTILNDNYLEATSDVKIKEELRYFNRRAEFKVIECN